MMLRTYADVWTKTYVTFGNVNGLTFNRQTVKASLSEDVIDVEGLPADVLDYKVEHFYFQPGEPVDVNWCGWHDEDGFHLLLSDSAIFVMNDAGATIDRIGELG